MKTRTRTSFILLVGILIAIMTSGCKKSENQEYDPVLPPAYQRFTDPRDGQAYEMVTIGTQVWMAQNLNFETPTSLCYENQYCYKYGRLYNWNDMMQGALTSNEVPSGVQGICPPGWHVPSMAEWQILIDYVGGEGIAGYKLKSWDGWFHNGNGDDYYFFRALPGGYYYGRFAQMGGEAYFWSSTDTPGANNGRYMKLTYQTNWAFLSIYDSKNYGMSLRCIKD